MGFDQHHKALQVILQNHRIRDWLRLQWILKIMEFQPP